MINLTDKDWYRLHEEFITNEPYNHIIIDNLFNAEIANNIYESLPDYNSDKIDANYNNPIERKKTIQNWTTFNATIYKVMSYFVGTEFTQYMRILTGQKNLEADYGLHGGGIHMHGNGDYLNVHYDYDIHPKLKKQRKLNIITYFTPDWKEEWNGHLELWSHDVKNNQPKECVKRVLPKFNRSIIFDTTQNSWHGLPIPLNTPAGVLRRSLAVYYVIPTDIKESRMKALFAPTETQKSDQDVLDFIKRRSQ